MKGVMTFEGELLEYVDMLKFAKEENDLELESESLKALMDMRRVSKEKELEALLSAENDPCSCYIEVQAGAGGTESNNWASMVMEMYKTWEEQRATIGHQWLWKSSDFFKLNIGKLRDRPNLETRRSYSKTQIRFPTGSTLIGN